MYPTRLIPSKEKVDKMNWCNDCTLVRSVDTKDEIFDQDGDLISSYIDFEDSLFCYSVNLVVCSDECTECITLEDVFIVPEDRNLTKILFDEDSENIPEPNSIRYSLKEFRSYFLLRIGDIHDQTIEYPKNIPNKQSKQSPIYVMVEHVPTIVNICHFQINTFDENGLIKRGGGAWKAKVHGFIRELIEMNAFKK